MSKTFDVGIESLASSAAPAVLAAAPAAPAARHGHLHSFVPADSQPSLGPNKGESATVAETGKSFYLETFGCQMNDHDSEKVSGVLLGRGYRQMETVDAAKVVLYNTCSIREKA